MRVVVGRREPEGESAEAAAQVKVPCTVPLHPPKTDCTFCAFCALVMPTLWFSKKPDVRELTLAIDEKTASLPRHTLAFAAFTLGAASTVAATLVYRKFFKRIPNGEWITPDMLDRRRWIKGRAVMYVQLLDFEIFPNSN